MNYNDAFDMVNKKANEGNKVIMKIEENDDYWFFVLGNPGVRNFDDGASSFYVSKRDGNIIQVKLWLKEIQELNTNFKNNSKVIYDYYKNV